MELMSSLLLCALAALVPLTLGSVTPFEFRIDELKLIGKKPLTTFPKVMLIRNSPIMSQNDHSVMAEPQCQHCLECMKMAMRSRVKQHKHVENHLPNTDEVFSNDIIESYHQYTSFRDKRQNDKFEEKTPALKTINKMKKNKAVTVTKYSNSGQVYALKIKEEDLDGGELDNEAACRVYRVKKYYPCDVPDSDVMKLFNKKKSKRSKKNQSTKQQIHPLVVQSTDTTKTESPEAKVTKTNADTSQIGESYITSLEELY